MSPLHRRPQQWNLAPQVQCLSLQEPRFKRSLLWLHFERPMDQFRAGRTLVTEVLQQGCRRHPSRLHLVRAMEEAYGAQTALHGRRRGDVQEITLAMQWTSGRFLPAGEDLCPTVLNLGKELLEDPRRGDGGEPFVAEVVERERQNLLRRIRNLRDHRGQYAAERFRERMCAGEPCALPLTGTEEEVTALAASDLEQARSEIADRASVSAIYVGSEDPESIREFLSSWFGTRQDRQALPPPVLAEAPPQLREYFDPLEVEQAHFCFGFRFPPPADSESTEALSLANQVFGGGPSSRLFQVVREQKSLAYSIYSLIRTVKGHLIVGAGIDPASYEAVLDSVFEQAKLVAEGGFSDAELETARIHLIQDLRRIPDSASDWATFMDRERWLNLNRTPAERIRVLEQLNREQVMEAAQQWQADTAYLLSPADQKSRLECLS
ncbi:MAG: insulinase family protein [Planctomycetota bacterium]|nr:MAG: insulinase family protein [Planctomycetota bacterium]